MDAIINNPFRVLGLKPYATDKEIAKRVSDLIIYSEMGKKIEYDTDYPFLGELDRSAQSIKDAAKKLELSETKIFYSLLCFDFKDNIENLTLELLKQGKIQDAINQLEDAIFDNCPVNLSADKLITNILKSFTPVEKDLYLIKHDLSPSIKSQVNSWAFGNKCIIHIKEDSKNIEIQEGVHNINVVNNYQLACKFKWLEVPNNLEAKICIGFSDKANKKYYITISGLGTINYHVPDKMLKSNAVIDVIKDKYYYLIIKKIDDIIEVSIDNKVVLKYSCPELFESTYLCLSSKQIVLIESLSISSLAHRKSFSSDIEINEITFNYTKILSLIFLLKIEQTNQLAGNLLSYFELIGNYYHQPYFKGYAKSIISDDYSCNFTDLSDIFIQEFYLSFKHLINKDVEYSELGFYSPFRYLSNSAHDKARSILLGPNSFIFENLLKETILLRKKSNSNTYELAIMLNNAATKYINWYSTIFGFGGLEYKIISDKIGRELLECAIQNYNSNINQDIITAKQSITIIQWASEFAFNQELRDRINENLSTLIKKHGFAEYHIIDFEVKEKEKYLESITYKGNSKNDRVKSNIPQRNKSIKNSLRKWDIIVISIFAFFIILAIISTKNGSKTSSISKNSIPGSKQSDFINNLTKGNKLENGASPYDAFFGKGVYDHNSECWLLFRNGNSTDAIVCLENNRTGQTIRNEYIQAGTNFKMTNLPPGVYQIKVFYGNDWNPDKSLKSGLIKGAFDSDLSYSVSDKINDLIDVKITETYNGISYTTGEITLYTVSNGNMQQRKIDSNEFFK